MVRDVSNDLRFALRLTFADPWFTIVAVSTLALGIGFNTTLYAIVNGMGSGPTVRDSERIVSLASLDPAGRHVGVSYLDFEDWRAAAKAFDTLAAYSGTTMNLTDRGLVAERVAGVFISASTFRILEEQPILGREFRLDDDRAGAARVAIIAAAVWKNRYGGDRGIIGRTITINGESATVVGVMPDGFRFPLVHDVWQPLASMPELSGLSRDARTLTAVGRLAHGVTLEQARGELNTIAVSLSKTYPATNDGVRPLVEPFRGGFDLTNPWNAMLGAVTIVLLIACANVANLLLARGVGRSSEIAIRMSLGASRWRIMRQFLVESLLLAVAAGVMGVGVAAIGVRLWLASMPVAEWPYWYHFTIDGRVLAYLTAVSGGSALLFGVGPAVHVSRCDPHDHLKIAGGGTATGPGARRWTGALLMVEFALTLSLLAGAGLLARTLLAVYRADSIVDTSPVMLAGVDLPLQRYATPAQRLSFYHRLEERIGALPGVDAVSVASSLPFYTAPVWSVTILGRPSADDLGAPTASYVAIGPRYFDTLRLRMVRGRTFTNLDGTPGHDAAVVNQVFASKYLSGLDPIGQRIRATDPNRPDTTTPWLEVVAVSPTVRQHYAEAIDPVVYVPYRMNPLGSMTLLTHASASAATLAPALREQLRQLDPDVPLLDVRPLDWLVSGTRFGNRVFATVFGIGAGLSLLLAAVGLHAITAYAIRQRTHEIGVRMALGARPSQVVWLFVRRTLRPLAWGLVLGLAGAFGVGRFVQGMLIQTSARDPATLSAITAVLVVVAVGAAVRPARRAARIDPAAALRSE